MPKKEEKQTGKIYRYKFLRPLLQNVYKVTNNLGTLIFNYDSIVKLYEAKCKGNKKGYDRSLKKQGFIGDLLSDSTFYSDNEEESHFQKLEIASAVLNGANNVTKFDKCEALSFLLEHNNNETFYPMYCQQIKDLKFIEHIDHIRPLLNSNFDKYIQKNFRLKEVQEVQDLCYKHILKQIDCICNNFENPQIESSFGTKFIRGECYDDKYHIMVVSMYCNELIICYPFISQDFRNELKNKCLDKLNSNPETAPITRYINDYISLNNEIKNEFFEESVEQDSDEDNDQSQNKNRKKKIKGRKKNNINNKYEIFVNINNEFDDKLQEQFLSQPQQILKY